MRVTQVSGLVGGGGGGGCLTLSTPGDAAVLPTNVWVGGVTPGSLTDPSRVPAPASRVPQLWNHLGGQPVLLGILESEPGNHRTRTFHWGHFHWNQNTDIFQIQPATQNS